MPRVPRVEERSHRLTRISAGGAEWIAGVVAERAPNAVRAMDPFHVVAWATDALDEERRAAWNRARREAADPKLARKLKHSRHALWKDPEDLTARQQGTDAAVVALDRWLAWAARSRIPLFVELGRRIRRHYDAILHAIVEQLSNGLIESTSTKTRLIVRRGFGFRTAEAIIALVMLCLGGVRPTLPRRQPA